MHAFAAGTVTGLVISFMAVWVSAKIKPMLIALLSDDHSTFCRHRPVDAATENPFLIGHTTCFQHPTAFLVGFVSILVVLGVAFACCFTFLSMLCGMAGSMLHQIYKHRFALLLAYAIIDLLRSTEAAFPRNDKYGLLVLWAMYCLALCVCLLTLHVQLLNSKKPDPQDPVVDVVQDQDHSSTIPNPSAATFDNEDSSFSIDGLQQALSDMNLNGDVASPPPPSSTATTTAPSIQDTTATGRKQVRFNDTADEEEEESVASLSTEENENVQGAADGDKLKLLLATGANDYGQSALSPHEEIPEARLVPVLLSFSFIEQIKKIACTSLSSIILWYDGTVLTAGCNEKPTRTLGRIPSVEDDEIDDSFGPVHLVDRITFDKVLIEDVDGGSEHALLLPRDGTSVIRIGDYRSVDDRGDVVYYDGGPDDPPCTTLELLLDFKVTAIAAGASFSIAVAENNEVYLVEGFHPIDNSKIVLPLLIPFSHETSKIQIMEVAAGVQHVAVIARDLQSNTISAYSFGKNTFGQLGQGIGQDLQSDSLSKMMGLQEADDGIVVQIASGSTHTLVRTSKGKVFGCGRNNSHQLGHQDYQQTFSTLVPIDYSDALGPRKVIPKIQAIYCGEECSALLTEEGQLIAMGTNTSGQLSYRLYRRGVLSICTPMLLTEVESCSMFASGSQHSLILAKKSSLPTPSSSSSSDRTTDTVQVEAPVDGRQELVSEDIEVGDQSPNDDDSSTSNGLGIFLDSDGEDDDGDEPATPSAASQALGGPSTNTRHINSRRPSLAPPDAPTTPHAATQARSGPSTNTRNIDSRRPSLAPPDAPTTPHAATQARSGPSMNTRNIETRRPSLVPPDAFTNNTQDERNEPLDAPENDDQDEARGPLVAEMTPPRRRRQSSRRKSKVRTFSPSENE